MVNVDHGNEAAILSNLIETLGGLEQTRREQIISTLITYFSAGVKSQPIGVASATPVAVSGAVSARSADATFSEDRTMSPKEFMHEKAPRSEVERVACLAYYLTHYRDQQGFKTVDLSQLNTEAAQRKLSNPAQAVNNAYKRHFLVQAAGGKGRKQISAIGERFIQALPDRERARLALEMAKPKRSSKKKKPATKKSPSK